MSIWGDMRPGSMPCGVSEIYQEGLQIPPVKIGKGDKIDEELMSFINANVRTKIESRGDTLAQIAANNVGRKRLSELIETLWTENGCGLYGRDHQLFRAEDACRHPENAEGGL